MTTESVLPIVALVLGYFGSHYTERWRERRARERSVLDRIADREGEALLELQDLLLTLPRIWLSLLENTNQIFEQMANQGQVEGASATAIATNLGPASEARNRAMMLASRVVDDDLRQEIREAINFVGPAKTVLEGGPIKIDSDAIWRRATQASDAIGERLRSPLSGR